MPDVAPVITTSLLLKSSLHIAGAERLFLIMASMFDHLYSLKYFLNLLFFLITYDYPNLFFMNLL